MSTDRTILSLKFGPRALRSQTHAAFHRLINVDTRRKFSDFEEIGRRQGCLFLALPSFLRKFVIFAFSGLNWTHSRRKEREKKSGCRSVDSAHKHRPVTPRLDSAPSPHRDTRFFLSIDACPTPEVGGQ